MTDVERSFRPGDRVQVRQELDDALTTLGVRTPPGVVDGVFDGEKQPSLVVILDDGKAVPYLASQVLLVERPETQETFDGS